MTIRVIQITARAIVPDAELFARIDAAGPGFAVQLRDPELDGRELLSLARALRERTRRVGAKLIINDRLDVAIAVAADGLHIGRRSIAANDARKAMSFITASAHDVAEVATAEADAVLLSPIFASPGKGAHLGVAALTEARRLLPERVRLFALGGIEPDTARACLDAGADGVASIRAKLAGPVLTIPVQ